jgi:hypothetical protein
MMVSNRKKLQKALFNTHTTIPIADHDVAAVLDGRVPHTTALQNPCPDYEPSMHKTD